MSWKRKPELPWSWSSRQPARRGCRGSRSFRQSWLSRRPELPSSWSLRQPELPSSWSWPAAGSSVVVVAAAGRRLCRRGRVRYSRGLGCRCSVRSRCLRRRCGWVHGGLGDRDRSLVYQRHFGAFGYLRAIGRKLVGADLVRAGNQRRRSFQQIGAIRADLGGSGQQVVDIDVDRTARLARAGNVNLAILIIDSRKQYGLAAIGDGRGCFCRGRGRLWRGGSCVGCRRSGIGRRCRLGRRYLRIGGGSVAGLHNAGSLARLGDHGHQFAITLRKVDYARFGGGNGGAGCVGGAQRQLVRAGSERLVQDDREIARWTGLGSADDFTGRQQVDGGIRAGRACNDRRAILLHAQQIEGRGIGAARVSSFRQIRVHDRFVRLGRFRCGRLGRRGDGALRLRGLRHGGWRFCCPAGVVTTAERGAYRCRTTHQPGDDPVRLCHFEIIPL